MGKPDKEEVINHLHIIHAFAGMAYEDMHEKMFEYMADWTKDAIELLKEQENRINELEQNCRESSLLRLSSLKQRTVKWDE